MKLVKSFSCFFGKDRILGRFELQVKKVQHGEKMGNRYDKYFDHDKGSVFLILAEVANFLVI